MGQKTKKQIESHYQITEVADTYDDRRFRGQGGNYINEGEIKPVTELLTMIYGKLSKKVLDIGAGRGRLSHPLSQLGHNVYCLDSSPAMTKHLLKFIPKKNLIIQSAFDPYPKSLGVDCITSLRFFDHFNLKDQSKLIKNSLNNLNHGGHLIFTGLNSISLEKLVSTLFPYGRYNYYYSDSEYRKMFSKLNLRVIARTGSFILPRGVFLYAQKIPLLNKILINIDSKLNNFFPKYSAYFVYDLMKQE